MKTADIAGGLLTDVAVVKGPKSGGLPFWASYHYIPANPLIGQLVGFLKFNSIEFDISGTGTPMDQVVEQVIETKEEVVELSLAELAQVGGGVGSNSFS